MSHPALFAVTHPGLESVLATELAGLGAAPGVEEPGGVELAGKPDLLARANLELRTASRILVRIGEFHARSFAELERHAARIPWSRWLGPGASAHVRVTAKKSKLNHERAIVERFGSAIAKACSRVEIVPSRAVAGEDEQDPDTGLQRFVVRLHRDLCTVSVDSSGPLLHRRGWRLQSGKAPLRETLAAGLLLSVGWNGTTPLVDPFCGSGTIPIEAALIARRIAPGLGRRFAFERWPETDRKRVAGLRSSLEERMLPASPVAIIGSDRDAGAIAAARANAERAHVTADIDWHCAPISALGPPAGPGLIATNPPYGARIGDKAALRDLYAQLGNVARSNAPGWSVAMISGDRDLERQVRLPFRSVVQTDNGGIPIRFLAATVPTR